MKCLQFSDNSIKITTSSAEETRRIGEILGRHAYPSLALLLYGDLGMGKTVLTQGVGKTLTGDRIKSPTFLIVSEHESALPLTHVDLCRLESARESDALDLEQYTEDGVLVVEWADRWPAAPQSDAWSVRFAPGAAENQRELRIEAHGERARKKFHLAVKEIAACCEEKR